MNRRSNKQKGYINFPTDKYKSTDEGGMSVSLIVIPTDKEFHVCAAGMNTVLMKSDVGWDEEKLFPKLYKYDKVNKTYERITKGKQSIDDYYSMPLLASMDLGTTGWSGGSGKGKNYYWIATKKDLTKEGLQIYNLIKKLYGRAGKLQLITYLDT